MKRVLFSSLAIFLLISLPLSGQDTEQHKAIVVPMICNALIPGFGFGSFMQGDKEGGLKQFITQLIGLVVFVGGFSYTNVDFPMGIILVAVGAGLTMGSRIDGASRAISYAKEYNAKLPKKVSFDAAAAITPSADGQELSIGMRLMVRYAFK
jgi:hypothetical protein